MKLFLKRVQLFLLFSALFFGALTSAFFVYYDLSIDDVPAPYLSSNFHYNEKLRFIRNSEIKPDIIYAGSSIALANFHSDTMTEKLGTDAHLNFSSQGLTLEHFIPLLSIQATIHRPQTLIFATNIYEFSNRHILFSYDLIEDYLCADDNPIQYYLKRFNLQYFMEHFPRIRNIRLRSDDRFELSYDRHGSVNITHIGTPEDRYWNRTFLESDINYRYDNLKELADFASSNNIKLIVVQTPIRSELLDNLSSEDKNRRKQHIEEIRNIIANHGFSFIDSNTVFWEDILFANGTHLNVYGAKKFSEFIFEELNSQ